MHGVEELEARENALQEVEAARDRGEARGDDGREQPWTLASKSRRSNAQSSTHRPFQETRLGRISAATTRLISRTAVYNQVRTVVWEGGAARLLPIPIGKAAPSRPTPLQILLRLCRRRSAGSQPVERASADCTGSLFPPIPKQL